jgi:hypothetical protein
MYIDDLLKDKMLPGQESTVVRLHFHHTPSVGNPLAIHSSMPPTMGKTLEIPNLLSFSATRALEASLGQLQ